VHFAEPVDEIQTLRNMLDNRPKPQNVEDRQILTEIQWQSQNTSKIMNYKGFQSQRTPLHIEEVSSILLEPSMVENRDDILVSTGRGKLQMHSDFIVRVTFSNFNPAHPIYRRHNIWKDDFPSKHLRLGSVLVKYRVGLPRLNLSLTSFP